MYMSDGARAFHTEEYKQIRGEVAVLLARVENLFRYSLIVTASIYAWLLVQSMGVTHLGYACLKLPRESLVPAWWIPPVFVVFAGLLAFAAYWRINQMGEYLTKIENAVGHANLGWEKFLVDKGPMVTAVTVVAWIALAVAAGFATCKGVALTTSINVPCTVGATTT